MITETNNILSFNHPTLNRYHIIRHGSMVLFLDNPNGKLLMRVNPFDNSVFVCDPSAIPLAALFGSKRFLVGEARKQAAKEPSAQLFSRDLTFHLLSTTTAPSIRLDRSRFLDQLTGQLTDILIKNSGFTSEKIAEYKASGDSICRYNTANENEKHGTFSRPIIIVARNNPRQIGGAIFADIIVNDTDIDIYLRDEMVVAPCDLGILFHRTRQVIHGILEDYPGKKVHAFIRAAAGKEKNYTLAACSSSNTQNYVIHGPATPLLIALDQHVKSQCMLEHAAPAPQKTLLQKYGWVAAAVVVGAAAAVYSTRDLRP